MINKNNILVPINDLLSQWQISELSFQSNQEEIKQDNQNSQYIYLILFY